MRKESNFIEDFLCLIILKKTSNPNKSELICNEESELIEMCPLCDDCTRWHLADICFTTKLNRLFDNLFTVFFSLSLNIWCKRLKKNSF